MITQELKVKDIITESQETKIKSLEQDIKDLNVILKIPKLHREFLQEKGTLDLFVEATQNGQDQLAKWTLLESGRKEIKQIIRR